MLAGLGTVLWNVGIYYSVLFVIPVSAETLLAKLLGSVMNNPLQFFTSSDTGITKNR